MKTNKEIIRILDEFFVFKDNMRTLNNERCVVVTESQVKRLKEKLK